MTQDSYGQDHIRDYPHPIICKPIIERDGIIVVSEEDEWVTLPWKDFIAFGKDKLLFKYLDGIFTIEKGMRTKGYICE
jgi:hypothetical protein